MDAVRRYLKAETNLLENIMLLMYLRSGQAPRSTEFFSLQCFNSPSTSRGIYIHNGSIMYVTRHSKARRVTNQEFQVARYLTQKDSNLLICYLTYVRPFTDMLQRVCYGRNQSRHLLFSSAESPENAWKVDILTKALKRLTKEVCGVGFGV